MNNNFLNNKKLFDIKNIEKTGKMDNRIVKMNTDKKARVGELSGFLAQYSTRITKYAQKYFKIDPEKDGSKKELIDYISSVRNFRFGLEKLIDDKDLNNGSFFDYCVAMKWNLVQQLNKEDSKELNNEFGYYFIYCLAYYMYEHSDKKVRDDLFKDFLEIMNSDEKCREEYLKLMSLDYNLAPYIEPDTKYCCPVIVAVLYKLDDKAVQRKVKKLIYNYSTQNYKRLDEVNNIEYELMKEKDIDYNLHMRNFAFTFIMDYLEDRVFLAPYSAFVRVLDKELEYLIRSNSSLIQEESNTVDEKVEVAFKECIEKIKSGSVDKVVKEIEENFGNILSIKKKSPYLIYGKSMQLRILDTYFADILKACSLSSFLDMDEMDKIRFILSEGYAFYLMEKLMDSEDFINKTIDVNSASILKEKDEEIKDRDKTISDLKEKIQENAKSVIELKKSHKDEINEKVEKTRKAFKKDIADLKKEIEKKDEEIKQLMDQREELFKLRELMFALENEEEIVIPQQESLESLSSKYNIVFVGGHEHVQRYMKNSFPNITYLIGDSESFDDRIIAKADYVFFCYKHMNHGVYQKVMKTIIAEQIKFDYVSTTNVNRLENEIVSKIEQGGKIRK